MGRRADGVAPRILQIGAVHTAETDGVSVVIGQLIDHLLYRSERRYDTAVWSPLLYRLKQPAHFHQAPFYSLSRSELPRLRPTLVGAEHHVRRLVSARVRRPQTWLSALASVSHLRKTIAEFRPDLIHVHGVKTPWIMLVMEELSSSPYRCRTILTVHGLTYYDESVQRPWLKLVVERATLRAGHLVTAVSKADAQRSEQLGGLTPNSVYVIPNAVRSVFFGQQLEQRERQRHPTRFVTVGSIQRRKNQLAVVASLGRLNAAGWHEWQYSMIGPVVDASYASNLRRLIRKLGLEDRVQLVGALTPAELAATLANCDVFVLPSTSEGLALVTLEALACGLPVVVPVGLPGSEVIVPGVTGCLFEEQRDDGLADALYAAAHLPWNKERIREYAVQFSEAAWGRQWEAIYERVLDSWRGSGKSDCRWALYSARRGMTRPD